MADEALIHASLYIRKGDDPVLLEHSSKPTVYTEDVDGAKGPCPGAFTASYPAGTDTDLSELTTPALCRIANLDATNFVTYGIWDPEISTFYPLGELLPGQFTVLRLSRDLAWEYGTGTGTSGAETNTLRIRPDTADCDVLVEAFEA